MPKSAELDHQWMLRCFDLARRGIGNVSPNPPVGAVLVHENRILGEGFHSYFGGPHAEVETFRSVHPSDRQLIPHATLYISLEPCCITGKTPPCTNLILHEGVKDVRFGAQDPNPDVAGKGSQLLKSHGIEVKSGILEEEALELIRPFNTNILFHRPYVILKWAQSIHGYIGKPDEKIWLSHPYTSIWTHKKRSMVDAVMVGARTVMLDDPLLTTREYYGRSPHKVIYDPNGHLTDNFRVFNDDQNRVFYFSQKENQNLHACHITKYLLSENKPQLDQIHSALYAQQIGILLVEGGAHVHNLYIRHNAWDEAWVIQTTHPLDVGIKAPIVRGKLMEKVKSATDTIIGILNEAKR